MSSVTHSRHHENHMLLNTWYLKPVSLMKRCCYLILEFRSLSTLLVINVLPTPTRSVSSVVTVSGFNQIILEIRACSSLVSHSKWPSEVFIEIAWASSSLCSFRTRTQCSESSYFFTLTGKESPRSRFRILSLHLSFSALLRSPTPPSRPCSLRTGPAVSLLAPSYNFVFPDDRMSFEFWWSVSSNCTLPA